MRLLLSICLVVGFRAPIQAQATTTTLAISSGGNVVTSVASGSVVTLTATVLSGSTPVTRGQVKFCDAAAKYCEDIHILGTSQLNSTGTAVFKFRTVSVGRPGYKAMFVGTKTYTASSSAPTSLSVELPHATLTSLTASASPASAQVTFSATVNGLGLTSPGPTGQVSFLDQDNGQAVVGTGDLGPAASGLDLVNAATPATNLGPAAVAVADFNADGIPDIAIVNKVSNNVTVLLGAGDGTFTAAASPATGSTPVAIATADFNGDGIPDLAIANSGTGSVTILLGKGDGTFTPSASPATDSGPFAIAVEDFNNDGLPDLAVANIGSGTISILLGNGDGTFTSATTVSIPGGVPPGGIPDGIVAADFNGDGSQDLAVISDTIVGTVQVFLGHGDGTFTAVPNPVMIGNYLNTIAAADLNGDGIPDLVISDGGEAAVMMGKGNGDFTYVIDSSGTGFAPAFAIGDFNGDGIPDLVGVTQVNSTATIYLGNGDGTFTTNASATLNYASSQFVSTVVTGDFNGDGFSDFVATGPVILPPNTSRPSQAIIVLAGMMYTASVSTTDALTPGQHAFVASYGGDSNYGPSVSSAAPVSYQEPVTFNLSAAPSAGLVAGQSTVLTATLSPYSAAGHSSNGETVNLFDSNNFLGAGLLSNGVATLTSPPLKAGSHSFSAIYGGDVALSSSTAGVTVSVAQATPTVTLSTSAAEVYSGASVTFTATVAGSGSGSVPTGTVSFYDGTSLLGPGFLTAGVATYTTSTLTVGTHAISAAYGGDPNFTAASSSPLSEVVVSGFTFAPPAGGSSSATASPGGQAAYTLAAAPASGAVFANAVTFTVTGLPAGATATFSPATIAAGAGPTNVTLTVAVPASAFASPEKSPMSPFPLPIALGVFFVPLAFFRKKSKSNIAWMLLVLAAGVVLAACGGSSKGSGSQPQNYTLTVTATSGSISQNTTLTLTVE